jgi:hypothetical protein
MPRLTWLSTSLVMCGFARVQVSMRPTMSVVLTPSVRLICTARHSTTHSRTFTPLHSIECVDTTP